MIRVEDLYIAAVTARRSAEELKKRSIACLSRDSSPRRAV
jgi:hypothetical protein